MLLEKQNQTNSKENTATCVSPQGTQAFPKSDIPLISEQPEYVPLFSDAEQDIINQALQIIETKYQRNQLDAFTSPEITKTYITLNVADKEREVFGVLFLDNQHRLIANELLFWGTIDAASVYPREVVKRGLQLNAAALIFYHNHPSGVAEPSQSDRRITRRLNDALSLVEIRVLDHFVVGGGDVVSFAERGWI